MAKSHRILINTVLRQSIWSHYKSREALLLTLATLYKLEVLGNWGPVKEQPTCHHLLGLVGLHVAVILSRHFLRAGLSPASLLSIKRVRIVFEDNELQKKGRREETETR